MKDEGYGSGPLLLSFLLGGVVGAGLALLLAPQSGRETRQKIREFSDEVKDKTEEYIGQAKAKVNSAIDEVKDKADVYIGQAKTKVNSAVDEGKGFIEEKKSLFKSAVDAGKEAYEKEKEKFSKG